jgi:hypothetical protein
VHSHCILSCVAINTHVYTATITTTSILYVSCITDGCLTKSQYIAVGKKRATVLPGRREEVYKLFKLYEKIKHELNMWAEGDLVYMLYKRYAYYIYTILYTTMYAIHTMHYMCTALLYTILLARL